MSYCRFSEGDVYAYACEGGVQFWVHGKNLDRLCNTYDSAYQYAKYLRDECGLNVPSRAIEALRADALDESSHGDGSAVEEMTAKIGELASKNAKLRHMVYLYRACHEHINACHGCEELPECDALKSLRKLGCELGIEVY